MQIIGWQPPPVDPRAVRAERRRRWTGALVRRRRVLAALVWAAAAGAAVHAVAPAAPGTVPVLLAAVDLPAGHRLGPGDLTAAELPAAAVPPTAASAAELTGSVLASPVARGEVLTTTRTAGPGLLAGAAAGRVAVAVPLAVELPPGAVRAGDVVAVLAGSSPDAYGAVPAADDPAPGEDAADGWAGGSGWGGGLLVPEAVVLVAPAAAGEGGGLLSGGGGGGGGGPATALLAVTPAQAADLAGATGARPLTLAVLAPG